MPRIFSIGWYRPRCGFWIIINDRPLIAFDWGEKFTVRFNLRTRVHRP